MDIAVQTLQAVLSFALGDLLRAEVTSDAPIDILHAYFKEGDLVPDIIPHAPVDFLDVHFVEAGQKAQYGNELDVFDCLLPPMVKWNDTDEEATEDSLYTLMFVGVDVGYPQYLYWLLTNIRNRDITNSTETISYHYPDPELGKEFNPDRLVLLVYRQPSLEEVYFEINDFLGKGHYRANFDIETFVEIYNFSSYPVAGNYFLIFPRIHRQYHPDNPPDWMMPFLPHLIGMDEPVTEH